jgi:hypothetical protein
MYQCINNNVCCNVVYQCINNQCMLKVVYQNEKLHLLELLEQLHQCIVGHDMTIQVIAEVVL